MSRDHARTPMQWDSSPNAGFTDGDPWFAVNENYPDVNVEAALDEERSIWHHYQRLIGLRHEEETLVYGDYDLLLPDDEQLYAYTRSQEHETLLVVLNWSDEPAGFDCPDVETEGATVLASNYSDAPADPSGREFRPYEAVVYRLDGGGS